MINIIRPFFLILISLIFTAVNWVNATDLPERYKKWLEDEVVYIISPREKSVFQKLNTDRERDLFSEAFWKQRDPSPNSPTNEFREEHYRRINYANHFFGRSTAKPGWKTDRGRMYIILGEPRDIMRTAGKSEVHPTETWFYQGMTDLGLPAGFHLIFFQRGTTGEYRLYSPLQDGPQMLLTSYRGDPRDYIAAYQELKEIDFQLAQFTLSFITGDQMTNLGRPSMASDLLVQRVESMPIRQIEDIYAQKFLDYKDIIDVEYSTNYIRSDSLVKVTKNNTGTYFVSYAIEPERLSVNQYQDNYYTTLKLNGTVSNSEGKIIYQYEKSVQLEFNEAQMRDFSHRTLNLQDMIPVIPGNIRLSVLLQNEASKEFTSLERELFIPSEEHALQMTSLITGYDVRANQPSKNRVRPFQNGNNQILFRANRVFLQKDDLWLSFQIHGINQSLHTRGKIKYSIKRDQKDLHSFTRDIKENPELPNFLEKISLKDFPPALYRIQVSLLLDGREVLTESEEFAITHNQTILRPYFYTKSLPGIQDPIYAYALGTQYYNNGQYTKARKLLDEAFQKNPDSMDIALQLAQALLALEEYDAIEPVLFPFINRSKPARFEAYLLMEKAYLSLGKYDEAIEVLNKSLLLHGLNPLTLNALGNCYIGLDKTEEALKALEKSLEIQPNQPEIQAKVKDLRKKK